MAAKKTKAGYDLLVGILKKNPKAVYADAAAAAKKRGLAVYPIMWGRAKAALGLVKSKPRGKGKAARAKAAKPKGRRAGRSGAGANLGDIAGILAAVKGAEQERAKMRAVLERIQAIVADALK